MTTNQSETSNQDTTDLHPAPIDDDHPFHEAYLQAFLDAHGASC